MDLTAAEIRVLGCLIEKQRTTPDTYPLSLNALRTACNQSTARDPVVRYDDAAVREAMTRLHARRWARLASSGRTPPGPPIDPASQAAIDQPPQRVVYRGDVGEVVQAVSALLELSGGLRTAQHQHAQHRQLVGRAGERLVGQKEERYMQLLGEGDNAHRARLRGALRTLSPRPRPSTTRRSGTGAGTRSRARAARGGARGEGRGAACRAVRADRPALGLKRKSHKPPRPLPRARRPGRGVRLHAGSPPPRRSAGLVRRARRGLRCGTPPAMADERLQDRHLVGQHLVPVAAGLALRRGIQGWQPLLILAASLAGASALSNLIKLAVGRARPADGLIDTISSAFPSGHATVAAAGWMAIAFVLGGVMAAPGPVAASSPAQRWS